MEELNMQNYIKYLNIYHDEKHWDRIYKNEHRNEVDCTDQYLIGFGRTLTTFFSTATDLPFAKKCTSVMIGDDWFDLPKFNSNFNNPEECVKFCLSYQYVMANLIACKKNDLTHLEFWLNKKEQLKKDLADCKYDPLNYFPSEKTFLDFIKEVKMNYEKKIHSKQKIGYEKGKFQRAYRRITQSDLTFTEKEKIRTDNAATNAKDPSHPNPTAIPRLRTKMKYSVHQREIRNFPTEPHPIVIPSLHILKILDPKKERKRIYKERTNFIKPSCASYKIERVCEQKNYIDVSDSNDLTK